MQGQRGQANLDCAPPKAKQAQSNPAAGAVAGWRPPKVRDAHFSPTALYFTSHDTDTDTDTDTAETVYGDRSRSRKSPTRTRTGSRWTAMGSRSRSTGENRHRPRRPPGQPGTTGRTRPPGPGLHLPGVFSPDHVVVERAPCGPVQQRGTDRDAKSDPAVLRTPHPHPPGVRRSFAAPTRAARDETAGPAQRTRIRPRSVVLSSPGRRSPPPGFCRGCKRRNDISHRAGRRRLHPRQVPGRLRCHQRTDECTMETWTLTCKNRPGGAMTRG